MLFFFAIVFVLFCLGIMGRRKRDINFDNRNFNVDHAFFYQIIHKTSSISSISSSKILNLPLFIFGGVMCDPTLSIQQTRLLHSDHDEL